MSKNTGMKYYLCMLYTSIKLWDNLLDNRKKKKSRTWMLINLREETGNFRCYCSQQEQLNWTQFIDVNANYCQLQFIIIG